jgi:amino acid transporter
LARDHPNAGSAYGFVSAILGPRAGLVAGWTLLGTYVCFAAVGIGAAGLFGANLLQRFDLWHDDASLGLTAVAAVVIAVGGQEQAGGQLLRARGGPGEDDDGGGEGGGGELHASVTSMMAP